MAMDPASSAAWIAYTNWFRTSWEKAKRYSYTEESESSSSVASKREVFPSFMIVFGLVRM